MQRSRVPAASLQRCALLPPLPAAPSPPALLPAAACRCPRRRRACHIIHSFIHSCSFSAFGACAGSILRTSGGASSFAVAPLAVAPTAPLSTVPPPSPHCAHAVCPSPPKIACTETAQGQQKLLLSEKPGFEKPFQIGKVHKILCTPTDRTQKCALGSCRLLPRLCARAPTLPPRTRARACRTRLARTLHAYAPRRRRTCSHAATHACTSKAGCDA